MSSSVPKRIRGQRVAGRDPVPKLSARFWQTVSRNDVLLRIAICLLVAVTMLIATHGWAPPFAYREGQTPLRNIVARIDFTMRNPSEVDSQRRRARRQARQVYINHPQRLRELQAAMRTEIAELIEAEQWDEKTEALWTRFVPAPTDQDGLNKEETARRRTQWHDDFQQFRFALSGEGRLKFDAAIEKAFGEIEKRGLLDKLKQFDDEEKQGNQSEVIIYPEKQWDASQRVEVKEVLIAFAKPRLLDHLNRAMELLEEDVKENARSEMRQTYIHDVDPLKRLQTDLIEQLDTVIQAKEFDDKVAAVWRKFLPPATEDAPLPDEAEQKNRFEQFRAAFATAPSQEKLKATLTELLGAIESRGLLGELKSVDKVPEGNRQEIYVLDRKDDATRQVAAVKEVRLADIKSVLRQKLDKELGSLQVSGRIFTWLERELPTATTLSYRPAAEDEIPAPIEPTLAAIAYHWLEDKLPTTLEYDSNQSDEIRKEAAAKIEDDDYATQYLAGENVLAVASEPIDKEAWDRLHAENQQLVATQTTTDMLNRSLAGLGMYLALYTLCGLFIFFRYPDRLTEMRQLVGLLALCLFTVILCTVSAHWKAEMIPLLLFGMTVAIAYNQEIALLVIAAVGLIVVLSLGQGLAAFVILMAATATAVLMLRRIRSRVKLVYVGFCSGAVALLTTLGVSVVDGQPMGTPLLMDAGLYFLWGVAAGFAMTGLLPFIESLFGVLTEISLLELGDVAHPLLQELVRRAPGTYNHSINVASMAEAAAERIGAQGLLVRVGAYFHDIGKILKPQYFIENQGEGANRHESLVPAMSTLIIIAHVKDGADLARQHHLPQPMIDFIQQHHGTTLVEYFYRRASEDRADNPDGGDVDEHTFRYPGPRPQSKEAGILMLADAVESASRVLVEPTPSRIESLVEDLAMKRLLDGQLDECGLTLQEVRLVQESLVLSLTAVYHGRVKYPDPITA